MFAFQLGREFKLSIAELLTVFQEGKTVYYDKQILILDFQDKNPEIKEKIIKIADKLGGTIKIIEISEISNNDNIKNNVGNFIFKNAQKSEGKFKYGISIFGSNLNIKSILNTTKNILKNNMISSRFINKNFTNLTSAQIIGEKLIQKNTDFNIITLENKVYLGTSIWVQNIDNYSKRDWQKDRDMQTGMLPPKLSQIMINISEGKIIYDPFVGLGTVLIESALMGNKKLFGSDVSDRMVKISKNNIESLNLSIEKLEIFKQNSKYISEIEILKNNEIDSIVTEGYLGEVMTRKNISIERIEKQKKSLSDLYEGFFSGLQKLEFKGNIVISFPFWELSGKYYYFEEIYGIILKYCNIIPILPENFELNNTKMGSLLYKRDKQLVGREIFKLILK